jgi:hypothetical protein
MARWTGREKMTNSIAPGLVFAALNHFFSCCWLAPLPILMILMCANQQEIW